MTRKSPTSAWRRSISSTKTTSEIPTQAYNWLSGQAAAAAAAGTAVEAAAAPEAAVSAAAASGAAVSEAVASEAAAWEPAAWEAAAAAAAAAAGEAAAAAAAAGAGAAAAACHGEVAGSARRERLAITWRDASRRAHIEKTSLRNPSRRARRRATDGGRTRLARASGVAAKMRVLTS